MSISEDIADSQIMLFVSSKIKYNSVMEILQPELEKTCQKIGYITLNKPFMTIISDLKKKNLDTSKFYFVDAITATVQSPPQADNCIFVSSPTALTDMGLSYSSLFNEKDCDLVFFDTISTLIVYQDIGSVIKFVHNLITKARVMNKKAAFLALKEDSEELIKDLTMFVDKIIEI
ncbi:MAG: hypothetical protein KKF44_02820 [Nanoarchaeota archaeon]|nr:hypothetical protein [Nanoarchaeota archaeon]